jgi:hypothetical protein
MVLTVDALADGVDPRDLVHRVVATVRPPRVAPVQDDAARHDPVEDAADGPVERGAA